MAKRSKLDSAAWHRHRFRDTAATPWLRAGIDVRTVQAWLGHESLATTQKIPGAVEGNGKAAREDAAAVLRNTHVTKRKPSELPLSPVFYTHPLQIIHVPRGLNLLPRKRVLWNSLMEYQSFISDILYLLANPSYRRTHLVM